MERIIETRRTDTFPNTKEAVVERLHYSDLPEPEQQALQVLIDEEIADLKEPDATFVAAAITVGWFRAREYGEAMQRRQFLATLMMLGSQEEAEDAVDWHCPVCKRPLLSADERCNGSFLESDHPLNVAPIEGEPNVPTPPPQRRQ